MWHLRLQNYPNCLNDLSNFQTLFHISDFAARFVSHIRTSEIRSLDITWTIGGLEYIVLCHVLVATVSQGRWWFTGYREHRTNDQHEHNAQCTESVRLAAFEKFTHSLTKCIPIVTVTIRRLQISGRLFVWYSIISRKMISSQTVRFVVWRPG